MDYSGPVLWPSSTLLVRLRDEGLNNLFKLPLVLWIFSLNIEAEVPRGPFGEERVALKVTWNIDIL